MSSPAQPTSAPAPAPVPRRITPSAKRAIDLDAALKSTIRAWLAARDTALWTFCAGTEPDPLAPISLSDAQPAVDRMNSLHTLALEFASQLADSTGGRRTAVAVLAESVEALLAEESPKFLLRVEHLPEAF